MDAGFDAGEFSGPAHGRMCEKRIEELAQSYGFTYDEVQNEIAHICHEAEEEFFEQVRKGEYDGSAYVYLL